ncbi:MAG: hypothetical protein KDD45_11020 [Bdellovibrionales bacterium]|nr:hypothetical protein [Bdellovibrionales bacterium]
MKLKHIVSIILSILFLFFGLFYILFDQYISSTAQEAISAWIKSEENSIIEGNLLSSITKTQKILLSSEIIKGVAILDLSDSQDRPLIEFGERIYFNKINLAQKDIQNYGLFKKYIILNTPSNSHLRIIFSIYSDKIVFLFLMTSALFSMLTLGFGFSLLFIKKAEQQKIENYANKARQAAHDLCQPIVVLNSLATSINDNKKDTIKSVVERINAIVDDLTDRKITLKKIEKGENPTSLSQRIENLISEKRLLQNNLVAISWTSNAEIDLLDIDQDYLLRVLSNFIQNSIEAQVTSISLSIEVMNSDLIFKIIDNGKGIPQDILSRMGEKGFTYGKKYGSGLGLFGAYEFARKNHGTIEIKSTENSGTEIKLILPQEKNQKIILTSDTKVFILDDDEKVLDTWKNKINVFNFDSQPEFFTKPEELKERLLQIDKNQIFVFTDYNLNETTSGLDLVEELELKGQSALVTGQFSDPKIIEQSKKLKVPLIPKKNLHFLEIEVV